jgi:hypothetical protein
MACVETGTFEQPADRSRSYFVVDPAGGSGGDSFTMAIGHQQGTTAILDLIRERPPPFSPEATVAEFASTLKQYGFNSGRCPLCGRLAGRAVPQEVRIR